MKIAPIFVVLSALLMTACTAIPAKNTTSKSIIATPATTNVEQEKPIVTNYSAVEYVGIPTAYGNITQAGE